MCRTGPIFNKAPECPLDACVCGDCSKCTNDWYVGSEWNVPENDLWDECYPKSDSKSDSSSKSKSDSSSKLKSESKKDSKKDLSSDSSDSD